MFLNFYKYQGAGNDFVMLDARKGTFDPTRERVAYLCDRHFGVGADGLMMLENDPQQEFRMRYFNADGGESTMCGNGGRCITLFAEHLGIGGAVKQFNSIDGVHRATLLSADDRQGEVALGMINVASIETHPHYCFLNTGSPHYVAFVPSVEAIDVARQGAEIRHSEPFRAIGGTNVNFVELLGENHIRIRTFERGVEAETLACGTGATACALATAFVHKSNGQKFQVDTLGGTLFVSFHCDTPGNFTQITLQGAAQKVFEGTIFLPF